jgi:hypothetical protein
MGRGAHAAHAAYNGSGTQGISVTNKINEDEDLISVFINENDTSKQILHGHDISEMTCAGKSDDITSERYKIFTPDENSDMLGDIYLNFEMDSEITDFKYVDGFHGTVLDLDELPRDLLTTSFYMAGTGLKEMDLDLTTRVIPPTKDVIININTVNKIKSFFVGAPTAADGSWWHATVQFVVGRSDTINGPNVAWRIYNLNTNEYDAWHYFSVTQFIEINDIIYMERKRHIILGGLLKKDRRRIDSGLYFMNLADFDFQNPSSWTYDSNMLHNFYIPKEVGYNDVSNSTPMYYVTVNTLIHINYSWTFIVSGVKSLTEDELSVVVPEYPTGSSVPGRHSLSPQSQTSKIFRAAYSFALYYSQDLSFDLIHNGANPHQRFASNPDFTSELRVLGLGTPQSILSCGSRFNTILGLDKDGLIIKSYDNGKTWEYSEFYYGTNMAEYNSEIGGQVYSISAIVSQGTGYSAGDVVTFIQSGASGGTGVYSVVSGVASVSVTTAGFGYTATSGGITFKRADGSGDATGTAVVSPVVIGEVKSISIIGSGLNDYINGEVVKLIQTTGQDARGTVTVVSGVVTEVTITESGAGYTSAEGVTLESLLSGNNTATGTVEIEVYRRTAAFNKIFDKGTYVDKSYHPIYSTAGIQDLNFIYFMPRVSQLHTNNTGVWTAIGQQGIQPAATRGDDRYRQFVFRSVDEGRTWHPIRLYTFPNKREINHVQFNSIDVEYISIYTTDREACKILMSVPPVTVMASVFVRSDWEIHWGITAAADIIESNADAVPGKSYVLLNVPSTLSLPWLGNVAFDTDGNNNNVLASLRSTFHRLIPWYGEVDDSNNSGLYRLRDGLGGNSNSVCLYEYLGAISDGKRDILFGKNPQVIDGAIIDIGIVTILSTRADPSTQDLQQFYSINPVEVGNEDPTRYPTETITIKLGRRRIIQNIVTTFLGMTAVLKDSNNSNDYKYEIIYSYNGLEWIKLRDIDNSSEVPIIQSDITGNVIYSYKVVNESHCTIFKITSTGEYSEINVLNNVFTKIEGINYAGTEWLITGTLGDVNVIVKSYDAVRWRKPNIDTNNYPVISSIVIKEKRLYESLVSVPDFVPGSVAHARPYIIGNFRTYEVCHSDYRTIWQGMGVRAYGMQDLDFSNGFSISRFGDPDLDRSIKINSNDGNITNSSTTSANDILQLRDGTILLCGESTHINAVGSYVEIKDEVGHDYIVLAEGPGLDGLTFTEASSIYPTSANPGGFIGMSKFAKSFYSLHETFSGYNQQLAIGGTSHVGAVISITVNNPGSGYTSNPDIQIVGDGVYAEATAIIESGSLAGIRITRPGRGFTSAPSVNIYGGGGVNASATAVVGNMNEGLLALRYIPNEYVSSGRPHTMGKHYWRFIFGTDQVIDGMEMPLQDVEWELSEFEAIHDVCTNDLREIVVVGKQKSYSFETGPIWFEKPDNVNFTTFRTDWKVVGRAQDHPMFNYNPLVEALSVCYTGTRWVFVGIPANDRDGQILVHTTDLSDSAKWVIEDFSELHPFNIIKLSDEVDVYSRQNLQGVSEWRGNHVRPVNYKGKSGVIINVSFLGHVDGVSNRRLEEKVYFMYDNDGDIIIEQNDSFPEPKILYREQIDAGSSIYKTDAHGGEQFRPTWETYIDGSLRTLLTTVYPSDFNQFVVDLNENKFVLRVYANPLTEDSFANNGTNWQRRYRKFITTDTFSLRNKIDGNCYKIAQVQNENFVTGVDSVRYLAAGKGKLSPIVKSDDLINWTDVDVKDIFTIVFDVMHTSGLWIAIGEGNYNLAISKDGKNWKGIYPNIQTDTLSLEHSSVFNSIDNYGARAPLVNILPYVPELKGIFLRNLSILRLFSRIEYHVGTQIWQTLTFDDIKALLDTEFGAGEYANLLKNCSIINKKGSTRLTTWIPGFTKTLNSKLETFCNISENGSFPSGLLKDQKLSIKIFYNKLENVIGGDLESSDMNNIVFDNMQKNTLIPCIRDKNYFIDSFLADNYGFQLGDTYNNVNGYFKLKFSTEIQKLRLYSKRFELDDVEIKQFNKGVKQSSKFTQSLYFDSYNTANLLLDLDSFNLYASHIIVSGWLTSGVHIMDMNLELNGYSYQKVIEPSVIDYATKSFLGLNYNRYTFNGVDKEDGIGSLVIPLASTAYSGSSVPLDRYTSIRLKINFNAPCGPRSYINVTCVGTTTVSYNNNTANIDIY